MKNQNILDSIASLIRRVFFFNSETGAFEFQDAPMFDTSMCEGIKNIVVNDA